MKTWKSWSFEAQFNADGFIFKVGTSTLFEKKWSGINNLKPEDIKVFGHWHRGYSGTWKHITLCQGKGPGSYFMVERDVEFWNI